MTGYPYLTAGVVSLDTPCFTFVLNEPTASDDFIFAKPKKAITITEIGGILQSGTNVVGGVDICDANGANCIAVDADITFNGSYDRDDTALTAPAVTAGYTLRWHTTSVSSPGYITIFVYYQ